MAIDVRNVANMIIEQHRHKLGDEIDIIFLYGSRQTGTTHRYSDQDMAYIPAHETTWAHTTVLVDDILFDLFPLQWSRLERMAEFEEALLSLIVDAEVVHYRSEEALARFRALQQRIHMLEQPESRTVMVEKALRIFQQTGYTHYQLRLSVEMVDFPSSKLYAQQIVRTISHSLMVVNQRHIDTRKLAQLLSLPRIPAQYPALLERIAGSSDVQEILAACEEIMRETRAILLDEQRKTHQRTTHVEAFRDAYPELKATIQKVIIACDRQDVIAANDAVLTLLEELAHALTSTATPEVNIPEEFRRNLTPAGFPELLPSLAARDFTALSRQCQAFDRHLRAYLTDHTISLNTFATPEELTHFMNQADLV